jgi:hypothetical protein
MQAAAVVLGQTEAMQLVVLVLVEMVVLVPPVQSLVVRRLVQAVVVVELTRVAQLAELVVLEVVAMPTLHVITQILEQQILAAVVVVPAVLPLLVAYLEVQVAQAS